VPRLDFRTLGPLEVECDGHALALGGAHQRAVLALLLIHRNQALPTEWLIDELWDEPADAAPVKRLQVAISRLRRVLGAASLTQLTTEVNGYRLRVARQAVDSARFEELVAHAQIALRQGELERAVATLEGALALWRGPPLADLADRPFAQPEIARLSELRLLALESRFDAELEMGRHRDVISELARLVGEHPLRERLRAQLMTALYRAGRHAHALDSYQEARHMLARELGLEPGPELRRLQNAILIHDPALEPGAERAPLAVATMAPPTIKRDGRSGRLPVPPTALLGRAAERRTLLEQVLRPGVRLTTLLGPGGVGKTRLALDVAIALEGAFEDGAWWIELAPVAGGEHVPATVARALEIKLHAGEGHAEALARSLGPRHALVVMDNFEHVLGAAELVAELLSVCPRLSVVATSREALDLAAEHRFEVPPLSVPAHRRDVRDQGLEESGATALFVDAAVRRNSRFGLSRGDAQAIAEICLRLDGLPLAVELAAARADVLTPRELAARLDAALSVLGTGPRDAPARQRTLRATLEWSHRLLDPEERLAFARFAVFRGGATQDMAEAVTQTGPSALEGLLRKQLLQRRVDPVGGSRMTMLETIRSYAREHLAELPEHVETHALHCARFVALAEEHAPQLEQTSSYALASRLDLEVDNFQAAFRWAVARPEPELALRLAVALHRYWELRDEHESARWIEEASALEDSRVPAQLRGRALVCRAYLLPRPSRVGEAEASARQAFALHEACGDAIGCADSLSALAGLMVARDRREDAFQTASRAVSYARRSGDPRALAQALTMQASSAPTFPAVLAAGEEAIERYHALGNLKSVTLAHTNLAYNGIVFGDFAVAQQHIDAGLEIAEATGDALELAYTHGNEGLVALFTGDPTRAAIAFRDELKYADENTFEDMQHEALIGLAAVLATQRRDGESARVLGAVEALELGSFDAATADRLNASFFAPARDRAGATAWERDRAAGARVPRRQAIAAALQAIPATGQDRPQGSLTPR
jgi:predicted ATPase/DNA-binding SARP family transcriptional activator